ncbi:hypothetical protein [Endozoicomonas sp. YOMI1]|uniref:hypothetical protein n=1 Tax=Endozoicomonas sp. YOMI1 TaxID=2828739 RepID=UPI0021475DB4|nr:hypothetical protein [Endozoicomonas sp. YOMI1]
MVIVLFCWVFISFIRALEQRYLGEGVLDGVDLQYDPSQIRVPGYGQSVNLKMQNPY